MCQVSDQLPDSDKPGADGALVRLPQNLVMGKAFTHVNNVKVTVFQFPDLPFLEWVPWSSEVLTLTNAFLFFLRRFERQRNWARTVGVYILTLPSLASE